MSDFPKDKAARGHAAAARRQEQMRRAGEKMKGKPMTYNKPVDAPVGPKPKFDDSPLKMLGGLW